MIPLELSTNSDARQVFVDRLPPRNATITLVGEPRVEDLSFIHSPLELFQFIGHIKTDQVANLFSGINLPFLYSIANREKNEVAETSKEAIKSIGEENVFDIAHHLVTIPERPITMHELNVRLLSGIRLSSELPLDLFASVITQYSNVARLEHQRASLMSEHILNLLSEMSYLFSKRIFESSDLTVTQTDTIVTTIDEDFHAFVEPIKNRLYHGSLDERVLEGVGSNFGILRRELPKLGANGERIINAVDSFVNQLGFRVDEQQPYYANPYVLADRTVLGKF